MDERVPSLPDWPDELAVESGALRTVLTDGRYPTPLVRDDALRCWLKREDAGPFATHKSRGLGVQLAIALAGGAERGAVISSSGNAAVAAGGWASLLRVPLVAFLSHKTPLGKVAAVAATGATTVVTAKPKNFSRYAVRYAGLHDLRPSSSAHGSLGYRWLAPELIEQLGRTPSAVMCFINSGLTAHGLAEGFHALRNSGRIAREPALHVVQCSASDTLAAALGTPARLEAKALAGALGAQEPVAPNRLAQHIGRTGGRLWMITNAEIEAESSQAAAAGLALESVAALAARRRARDTLGDDPVVIVAAPERAAPEERFELVGRLHRPSSYAEMRALLERLGWGRADD